jgi:branched-subunit amino acid ABC-type transport system permease component
VRVQPLLNDCGHILAKHTLPAATSETKKKKPSTKKNPPKRFNRSLFARGGTSFIFLFVFLLLQKTQRGRELGATSFTRRAAAAAGQVVGWI